MTSAPSGLTVNSRSAASRPSKPKAVSGIAVPGSTCPITVPASSIPKLCASRPGRRTRSMSSVNGPPNANGTSGRTVTVKRTS